jgi:hypothetical protein
MDGRVTKVLAQNVYVLADFGLLRYKFFSILSISKNGKAFKKMDRRILLFEKKMSRNSLNF